MKNDLFDRLDNLRWNKFHTIVSIALGIAWVLDSFEVMIVTNILYILKKMWSLSAIEQSWIVSIWLIGIMIGAYFMGYLSDKFGRKRLFLITLTLYGTFTLLTTISWNFESFLVLRLITALGIGAEYAAINAAISEFIPTKYRGKVNATVMNFWSFGPIFAALVTIYFINTLPPEWGWRVAFGFGALVSLAALVIRRYIPESPRWLVEHGEIETATRVVEGIEEGRVVNESYSGKKKKKDKDKHRTSFFKQTKELLTQYPGRVALGCLLDFSDTFGYYGLFAILPISILPAIHLKESFVPFFYLISNIGGVIGGILAALLLEGIGRKKTVPLFFTLAAVSVLLLAYSTTLNSWIWVLFGFTLAISFANGSWISAYVTFTEFFPTHLRSTGIGLSVAFGRIGGIISPLILTAISSSFGVEYAIVVLASVWLIGTFAMVPWYFKGIEGKGTTLEDMVMKREKIVG
ncbi:MFS transporter [Bacillus smithii]|uniref:MFS transporter n=1 Tax=Bacillus smithii TaxID=1479 RepID=UPI003D210D24